MATSQRSLLRWVERQVLACRPIALRYFRSAALRVERKADASPVTAADRAIEEQLRAAIGRAFPGEAIVGEEFGRSGLAKTAYWTIDPIDGTRAFSHGLPSWGILVGRVERGRPTLGLCDFPAIGVTIGVAPGVPAYERHGTTARRLSRPRRVPTLREAVIFHGGLRWWKPGPYLTRFTRLLRQTDLERAYGDCYGYLWALRGRADAVLDYGVKLWDLVPLAALARATGRVMTDFRGRPSWTGPDSIFASPHLARLLVNALHGRL